VIPDRRVSPQRVRRDEAGASPLLIYAVILLVIALLGLAL
jgi:hypothetical protein